MNKLDPLVLPAASDGLGAIHRGNGHYYIDSSFAVLWNPPGHVIYPAAIPSGAAQGAHYPAGTRGSLLVGRTPRPGCSDSEVTVLVAGRRLGSVAAQVPGTVAACQCLCPRDAFSHVVAYDGPTSVLRGIGQRSASY